LQQILRYYLIASRTTKTLLTEPRVVAASSQRRLGRLLILFWRQFGLAISLTRLEYLFTTSEARIVMD
jgi:hypothetical protein